MFLLRTTGDVGVRRWEVGVPATRVDQMREAMAAVRGGERTFRLWMGMGMLAAKAARTIVEHTMVCRRSIETPSWTPLWVPIRPERGSSG